MVTRGYSWLLVQNAEIFKCVRGYSCIYVSEHVRKFLFDVLKAY